MISRMILLLICLTNPQEILAEEIECEGGSLFEKDRKFKFIREVDSNDYIVITPSIENSENDSNDFLVTVDIKDFSIWFLSMSDRKTSLAILSYTNGFKVGNISGNYKDYWNYLTCSILD